MSLASVVAPEITTIDAERLSLSWIFSDTPENPLGNFDDFEFMYRPEDVNPDACSINSINECTVDTCDPCTVGMINSGCTTCCNVGSNVSRCFC